MRPYHPRLSLEQLEHRLLLSGATSPTLPATYENDSPASTSSDATEAAWHRTSDDHTTIVVAQQNQTAGQTSFQQSPSSLGQPPSSDDAHQSVSSATQSTDDSFEKQAGTQPLQPGNSSTEQEDPPSTTGSRSSDDSPGSVQPPPTGSGTGGTASNPGNVPGSDDDGNHPPPPSSSGSSSNGPGTPPPSSSPGQPGSGGQTPGAGIATGPTSGDSGSTNAVVQNSAAETGTGHAETRDHAAAAAGDPAAPEKSIPIAGVLAGQAATGLVSSRSGDGELIEAGRSASSVLTGGEVSVRAASPLVTSTPTGNAADSAWVQLALAGELPQSLGLNAQFLSPATEGFASGSLPGDLMGALPPDLAAVEARLTQFLQALEDGGSRLLNLAQDNWEAWLVGASTVIGAVALTQVLVLDRRARRRQELADAAGFPGRLPGPLGLAETA
jgi:hypothetical protein